MSSLLMSILRTGAQALGGYVFSWLASRGIDVPVDQQDLLVQVVLVGLGVTAYTAAVRWLESRHGDGVWPRMCRAAAKLLMLGLSGKQPVYVEPDQRLRVVGADGELRPPR